MSFLARHARKFAVVGALLLLPVFVHYAIGFASALTPPETSVPSGTLVKKSAELRIFGDAWARRVGKLWLVRLSGDPEQIGYRHVRLLYDRMVDNEGVLLGLFEQRIKNPLARVALLDLAQLRYRDVDDGMSPERLREIAGGARAFDPDPYTGLFDTYKRFVYLNALYDISLSFEGSPLVGCTTFALRGKSVKNGGVILGRAFDFDVADVFDQDKAVFFVLERGQIPFASVAWPGLVGVVSGMNAEGVAVVVHGGRAGKVQSSGEPVVHALRRILSTTRSIEEAVEAFRKRDPMVSHIVIIADASGRAAAVERVPGIPPYMYWLGERAVVTNHFEGAAAEDPKNQRVRDETSSVARRRRGEQLVNKLEKAVRVEDVVQLLRDRRGLNDGKLELGDRSAIDAMIATHGVVFEPASKRLWVSESPHLLGRFVSFDLAEFLAPSLTPEALPELPTLNQDPLLTSGDYERWRASRSKPAED